MESDYALGYVTDLGFVTTSLRGCDGPSTCSKAHAAKRMQHVLQHAANKPSTCSECSAVRFVVRAWTGSCYGGLDTRALGELGKEGLGGNVMEKSSRVEREE
jgi:hypothetical protein